MNDLLTIPKETTEEYLARLRNDVDDRDLRLCNIQNITDLTLNSIQYQLSQSEPDEDCLYGIRTALELIRAKSKLD